MPICRLSSHFRVSTVGSFGICNLAFAIRQLFWHDIPRRPRMPLFRNCLADNSFSRQIRCRTGQIECLKRLAPTESREEPFGTRRKKPLQHSCCWVDLWTSRTRLRVTTRGTAVPKPDCQLPLRRRPGLLGEGSGPRPILQSGFGWTIRRFGGNSGVSEPLGAEKGHLQTEWRREWDSKAIENVISRTYRAQVALTGSPWKRSERLMDCSWTASEMRPARSTIR